VVELVGGIEPARTFIRQSLERGKHVVTANKALLALEGFSLMRTAEKRKVRLGFEGRVCGGIPIIRALRNGLVGNKIQKISGILNGTCNYILTRMAEEGTEFTDALRAAQAKGFAEADPTLDIDGHDAAQKLKILAELAFNAPVPPDAISLEGIRCITAADVKATRELGYVIKHVAVAEMLDGALSLCAEPVLLASSHQLAGVRDENNAVLIYGDAVGEMLFSGKGAGPLPSASAVLSDMIDIACHQGGFSVTQSDTVAAAVRDYPSPHYFRFDVGDPSAIGRITAILERHGIGVTRAAAVWSKNGSAHHQVRVLTDAARRSAVGPALQALDSNGAVSGHLVLRIAD